MADSAMDRTARWVQRHSNITQPYEQPMHLSSLQHRARLQREDGHSSQSSRTDLGAPDQGIGSSGRTRPKRSSTVAAVAGSIQESGLGDRALPPNTRYQHHRSHSHSLPHEHHPHQRLNIPPSLYQNQKFVHGPPGSGYPMPMVAASPPIIQNPIRTGIRGTPSPPLRIPVPLNPKKSRPTVERRRPSLSGTTFEPPVRSASAVPSRSRMENREPRGQGLGDAHRVRARATSESRRR